MKGELLGKTSECFLKNLQINLFCSTEVQSERNWIRGRSSKQQTSLYETILWLQRIFLSFFFGSFVLLLIFYVNKAYYTSKKAKKNQATAQALNLNSRRLHDCLFAIVRLVIDFIVCDIPSVYICIKLYSHTILDFRTYIRQHSSYTQLP